MVFLVENQERNPSKWYIQYFSSISNFAQPRSSTRRKDVLFSDEQKLLFKDWKKGLL
jgi:hypothetical protein